MRVSKVFNNNDHLPLVIKTLALDEKSKSTFSGDVVDHLEEARMFFKETEILESNDFAMPIFEAFAKKTDPTYTLSDKGQGSGQYIDWITDVYAQQAQKGKSISAEDLFKISDQLAYFAKAKIALKQAGHSTTLSDYETLGDFRSAIVPMFLRHQDKQNKGRGMPANVRDETTILYDGPEGKVLMPHSVNASQFWGQGTTWCISERFSDYIDEDELRDAYSDLPPEIAELEIEREVNKAKKTRDEAHAFHNYNQKSPVIIYAPKGKGLKSNIIYSPNDNGDFEPHHVISGKVAIVENEMYNELDDSIEELPSFINDLRTAALNAAPNELARSYIENYGTISELDQLKKGIYQPLSDPDIKHNFNHLSQNQQVLLDQVRLKKLSLSECFSQHKSEFGKPDFIKAIITVDAAAAGLFSENILNNKNFAMLAVQENGLALRHLGGRAKRDPEVVNAALEQNGLALQYAPVQFKENLESVITALRQNPQSLNYADPSMLKNLDVAIAAMETDIKSLKLIDKSLFEESDFIMALLDIAENADMQDQLAIMGQLHRVPALWGHMNADIKAMRQHIQEKNSPNDLAPEGDTAYAL